MKPEFISISRFAIIATIAGSLSVIGTIRAQEGKEDTGIGSAGEHGERFKWQLSSTSQVPRSPA